MTETAPRSFRDDGGDIETQAHSTAVPKKRKKRREKPNRRKQPDDVLSSQVDSGFAENAPGHGQQADDAATETGNDQELPRDEEQRRRVKKSKNYRDDESFVLSVTIHSADRLKPNIHISHPVVRVHIIDATSGCHVKKLHASRQVTSYFEKDNASVDYVMPVLSQPFSIRENRTLVPCWEETLVFNEDFSHFLANDVILFFEILDFLGMKMTDHKWTGKRTYKGWHRIAWAFLKLRGSSNEPNCEKRLRLQLFHYPTRTQIGDVLPDAVEIFHIYSSSRCPRVSYPSTLHVTPRRMAAGQLTAHAAQRPSHLRSLLPTEEERGEQTFEELDKTRTLGSAAAAASIRQKPPMWSRLPGQTCRIPNRLMHSLPAGKRGCLAITFSHDGRSLAAACGDSDLASFPIMIYEIPSGDLKGQLSGHHNLIYDVSWSSEDRELISASSDGTVNVWDVKSLRSSPVQVLPHPCFVYAAQYHPSAPWLVVTGGYDHTIRAWSTETPEKNGRLLREMDGHRGLINSIVFDAHGIKMFSGDSTGMIIMWKTDTSQEETTDVHHWTALQRIKDPEIHGVAINQIVLHPNARRLCVYSRDNTVRIYDLRINAVVNRCVGATNFRERLHCAVSQCGSFVMAGSEDGRVYVWNSDSGDRVAVYADLPFGRPVADVAFHPHDHIVAFCSFGDNQPIVIYKFVPTENVADLRSPPPPSTTSRSMADAVNQRVLVERVSRRLSAALQTSRTARETTTTISRRTHDFETTSLLKDPWQPSFKSVSGTHDDDDDELRQTTVSPHTLPSWKLAAQLAATGSLRRRHQRSGASDATTERNPLTVTWQSSLTGTIPPRVRSPPPSEYCRALYDYKSARGDELSFASGDVLAIVHKESDNWWVAQAGDGKQGYVPTNYIAPYDVVADMVSEAEELQETRERSGIGIPLFGVPLATSPIPPSPAPFSTEKEESKSVDISEEKSRRKKKKRRKINAATN
ncbi:jouberin-like isoform X2 [Oscarella lobularis]|uniref:jouberin-like isoform X2 n=1 Tax=Oscarella lobularis TaxID=121494 RepID=UPI0033143996